MTDPTKAREWWIDPDYDGYQDDTDENLIASGYVKAVDHSAYAKLLKQNEILRDGMQAMNMFTAERDYIAAIGAMRDALKAADAVGE